MANFGLYALRSRFSQSLLRKLVSRMVNVVGREVRIRRMNPATGNLDLIQTHTLRWGTEEVKGTLR
jgi:hypothetical protein